MTIHLEAQDIGIAPGVSYTRNMATNAQVGIRARLKRIRVSALLLDGATGAAKSVTTVYTILQGSLAGRGDIFTSAFFGQVNNFNRLIVQGNYNAPIDSNVDIDILPTDTFNIDTIIYAAIAAGDNVNITVQLTLEPIEEEDAEDYRTLVQRAENIKS